jgi:hypothetical protein
MQALAFGAAVSQGEGHPYGQVQNRPSLRFGANGSAPNFFCGHIGSMLGLHLFYKDSAKAAALFSGFDIAAFRNQATGQDLPKIAGTWAHPLGGITDAQINAMIRNFVWWGQNWTINSVDSLLGKTLLSMTAANDGLNGGIGIRDAEVPNQTGERGISCKQAVGRGKKYASTPSTPFTRMCTEFATGNGIWSGITNPNDYADLNKRSDFNYAWIAMGSVIGIVTGIALAEMFTTKPAFVTLRNDANQAVQDANLKSQGYYSVSNISLKAAYSDFDSSRHTTFAVRERMAGWTRIYNLLTG